MKEQTTGVPAELFFFFSPCTGGLRKFPGQESNLHHSKNLSHSSDRAGFLTR